MPTPSRKYSKYSYKPKAVARRKAQAPPPEEIRAPSLCTALPPAPGLEALHITLQPGSEFRIDFGLAHGQVVLRYPLGANPQLIIQPEPDGGASKFEFQRLEIVKALVGELGGRG